MIIASMNFKQQVIFWILILIIMTLIFGGGNGNYIESFYFVCMLLPVTIGTSWYFNNILVPKYLINRKYLKFGLYFLYSMIISLWLQMLVVTVSLIILANYDMDNMNPLTTNVQLLGIIIYLIVFVQAFIQMFIEMGVAKEQAARLEAEETKRSTGYLMIKSDRRNRRLEFDNILYVESLADYVKIVLREKENISTRETISGLQERLPSNFIRIHRSFIVQKEKITSFNKEEVIIEDYRIPVSRKYKASFLSSMKPIDNFVQTQVDDEQ